MYDVQQIYREIRSLFENDVCIFLHLDEIFNLKIPTEVSNIVVLTVDHWGDDEYLLTPKSLRPTTITSRIKEIVASYPTKNFYITTCCPFVTKNFEDINNLKIIHWGDDFLLHPNTNYYGVQPVLEKQFNAPWHWLSLCNNLRMHRNICTLFLLGENINNGLIRFDNSQIIDHDSWESFRTYLKINKYNYLHKVASKIYPILKIGFDKVKSHNGYESNNYKSSNWTPPQVAGSGIGTSRINYEENLRLMYINSAVDIITETVFINNTGIITEKYINSVYGCNFPIIIGMPNTVAYLRSLGFDLFDDIIDHTYDTVADHYSRMIDAIITNRKMLDNRQYAIDHWHKCKSRFQSNITIIENMYKNREILAMKKIRNSILPMATELVAKD